MTAFRLRTIVLSALVFICLSLTAAHAYSMPYYIDVDLSNNIVTVYSSEDESIVRQMICSSGTYINPSPTGAYYMPEKYKELERTEWYTFQDGFGKYGSRIWGNYLFHSYLFDEPDEDTLKWDSYAAMGTSASHGCIRLYIEDAKWIADNCMPGTKVNLFTTWKRYEYIKEILYGGTFTVDNGLTYEQHMCMADDEGEMGFSSKGDNVADFQQKLIALGLYDGKADGEYGAQMVRTVKALQRLLGQEITGVADAQLIEAVSGENCPASCIGTLSEGMTGNAVSSLQNMLISLGLYVNEPGGVFDAATREAVVSFQRMKDMRADGVATPVVQQALLAEIESLNEKFGESGFILTQTERMRTVATINAKMRLNVRAQDGTVIGSVEPGAKVEVIEPGIERTLVICENGLQGTVSSANLVISEETVYIPEYTKAEGAPLPALNLQNFAATKPVSYGTVNMGSNLRIRTEPNTDSDLLFLINPGDICEILSTDENGWAYIRYGKKTGYAIAKYLDIKTTVELTGELMY